MLYCNVSVIFLHNATAYYFKLPHLLQSMCSFEIHFLVNYSFKLISYNHFRHSLIKQGLLSGFRAKGARFKINELHQLSGFKMADADYRKNAEYYLILSAMLIIGLFSSNETTGIYQMSFQNCLS